MFNIKIDILKSDITWHLFHGRLPTEDTLRKHGFSFASICRFYCCCKEFVEHLFLLCPFVGFLWQSLGTFFGLRISLESIDRLISDACP